MKQEILSFLSTIEDEICNISKNIYEISEESFHENKSSNYLSELLNKHNFKIQKNYLNINTSFKAEFGSGHPKICFLCHYDGINGNGQIYGHNMQSAMSIGAAISLSKIIPKISASIVVIGCPGEILSGSELTMIHQGAFEDLDIVLMAQPYTKTAIIENSKAILPIELKCENILKPFEKISQSYSPIDSCLFMLDNINFIIKEFQSNSYIKNININSNYKNSNTIETIFRFLITSSNIKIATEIQDKIDNFICSSRESLNIKSKLHMYDLPCKEIIPNDTLCRLFSHNLKEIGITDISSPENIEYNLSIGNVSHEIPTIDYCINITKDKNIQYGTKEFAISTQSNFANRRLIKTAGTLAITALDLIEKEALLSEAKIELSHKITKPEYSLI